MDTGETLRDVVLVIAGPTASGKTALAIELARRLSAEVLSADSRQCYRELPIGTAAPTLIEQAGIPHHFVLDRPLTEPLTAARYGREARNRLAEVMARHPLRVAIVAGGSGLYLEALIQGLNDLPEASPQVRSKLQARLEANGLPDLLDELARIDPPTYQRVDRDNPRRVLRALEVYHETSRPLSAHLTVAPPREPFPWRVVGVALDPGQAALRQRISVRTRQMIDRGLLDEARAVIAHRQEQALQTVGYRETFQYLDGNLPGGPDALVRLIDERTAQYAKRQRTWLRHRAPAPLLWLGQPTHGGPPESHTASLADQVLRHAAETHTA